jgi:hypothetical protein
VLKLAQYHIMGTFDHHLTMKHLHGKHRPGLYMEDVVLTSEDYRAPEPSNFAYHDRLSMLAHVPELSLVIVGSAYGRVTLMTPVGPEHKLKGGKDEEDGGVAAGRGGSRQQQSGQARPGRPPGGLEQDQGQDQYQDEDDEAESESDGSETDDGAPPWFASPGNEYSFQLEAILPNAADDRLRPKHPLYGMAVGPINRAPAGAHHHHHGHHGHSCHNDNNSGCSRHPMDLASGDAHERPAFRLMLHYRDFSILSWELRRGAGNQLEIQEIA